MIGFYHIVYRFVFAFVFSKFSHVNIVECLGISVDKPSMMLVLELLPGGDLKTFLRDIQLVSTFFNTISDPRCSGRISSSCSISLFIICITYVKEKCEDTKGIIRSRKSKKDR